MFGQSLLSGAFGSALDPGLYFDTNLYTGTGVNQTIGGKIKGAASFNGSNTGMVVPGNMSTLLGNEFSVSFWFYTPTTFPSSGYPTFASLYGYPGYGSAYGWSIEYPNSGKIMFYWVSANSVGNNIQSSALTSGEWCHVICTKDSTSANIYINNVLDNGSTAVSSNAMWYNGFEHFTVGCKQTTGAGGATSGHISDPVDQMRIFTSVLTSAERAAVYAEDSSTANTLNFPTGAGCVAAYQFDNNINGPLNTDKISTCDFPSGAGCQALYQFEDDVTDTCGNYNGTAANITYATGSFDKAAVFNGSSSTLVTGWTHSSLTFSASCWVKFSVPTTETIITTTDDSGGAANDGFTIAADKCWVNQNDAYPPTALITYSATVNDDVWHNIVVTNDGTTFKVYIDGSLDGSVSSTGWTDYGTNPLVMGYQPRNPVNQWYTGQIDQVRIFSTALTQSQVNELARGADSAKNAQDLNNNIAFNGWTNFKPDLVWIKKRGPSTANHLLQNTVNGPGTGSSLSSNSTAVAGNFDQYGYLSSFNEQGFTTQGGTSGGYPYDNLGESGSTYVSWNWKAGGSGSDNFYKDGTGYASAALAGMNTGSLTPTKSSVNTVSGLSIVTLNSGGSTADVTVSHGLGVKPAFVLFKKLNSEAGGWFVWHQSFPTESYYLYLQDTYDFSQLTQSGNAWGNQSFDANNISFRAGWTIETNRDLVIYSFAEIAKYSKMGSYTGNGNATGPIVSTGFEPAWIIIKAIDSTGESWIMFDAARNTSNPRNCQLRADTAGSQSCNTDQLDFNANNFQIKTSWDGMNKSGTTYIYMTFGAATT